MSYKLSELDNALAEKGYTPEGHPINQEQQVQPQQQMQGQQEQMQQEPTNPSNLLLRGLGDIAHGGAEAGRQLHNLPYNLTNWFSPKTAESMPRIFHPDTEETHRFGVNNPNMMDKLIQSSVPAVTLGALAGPSLAGMVGSGALTGAMENENDPVAGALLGGSIGGALKGGHGLLKHVMNARPERYGKQLVNRGTEEYLEGVAKPSIAAYNEIKEGFKGHNILEGKELPSIPYSKKEFNDAYKLFTKNKGYEEAQELTRNLGDEARNLYKTKLRQGGTLDTAQRAELRTILKEKKTLDGLMNERLERYPQLKTLREQANLSHRKEVIPSRNAAKTINDFVDEEGYIFDKKGLINALNKSSSKNSLTRQPMPKETLKLNKLYSKNLESRENIGELSKRLLAAGIPMAGIGYSHRTIRDLMNMADNSK